MLTRRLTAFVLAVLFAACMNTPSDARQHRKSKHHTHHYSKVHISTVTPKAACDDRYPMNCGASQARQERRTRVADSGDGRIVSHPTGCPWRAFCGCGSCAELGISASECKRRGLFLAANWLRFPSASPGPGMAAARRGHVMIIRDYLGGNMATVYDANSGGHQTRVHTRSLAGYRVVNPNGSRVAMR